MAAKKPGRGTVVGVFSPPTAHVRPGVLNGGLSPAEQVDATRSGRWRPDAPFNARDGVKVTLRRIPGVTPAGTLEVPLRLQVPPLNDFARRWTMTWGRYTSIDGGERARAPSRPLFEQAFSTMLLDDIAQDDHLDLCVWTGAPDPQRLLEELTWIMGQEDDEQRGSVFRLTISQTALWPDRMLVDLPVFLSDLTATQKGGEPGTEYVDLTFTEHRGDRVAVKSTKKKRGTASDQERSVSVRPGESLHELAQRVYHRPSEWRSIASANGISGVSASSATELARWLKKHNRSELIVPALFDQGAVSVGGVS